MNKREKAERIEALKARVDVDQNVRNMVFKTAMGKGLHKFLAVSQTQTSNQLRTKADLYRRLLQFRMLLDEKIIEFETELTEREVEVYFSQDEEYVKTEKNPETGEKMTVIKKITTGTEWKKALGGVEKG